MFAHRRDCAHAAEYRYVQLLGRRSECTWNASSLRNTCTRARGKTICSYPMSESLAGWALRMQGLVLGRGGGNLVPVQSLWPLWTSMYRQPLIRLRCGAVCKNVYIMARDGLSMYIHAKFKETAPNFKKQCLCACRRCGCQWQSLVYVPCWPCMGRTCRCGSAVNRTKLVLQGSWCFRTFRDLAGDMASRRCDRKLSVALKAGCGR